MEAYVKNADTITVGVGAFFHGDPVEELEQARQRNMVIGGHPVRLPEILARRDAANVKVMEMWEELRQESHELTDTCCTSTQSIRRPNP